MAKKTVDNPLRSALLIYPPEYRQKYKQEILTVFKQQLNALPPSKRLLFTLRSFLNLFFGGLERQVHVLVGITLLTIGLIVVYDQSLHALDGNQLIIGLIVGVILLITSVGLFLKEKWTIYTWLPVVAYLVFYVAQDTYWTIQFFLSPLVHLGPSPIYDIINISIQTTVNAVITLWAAFLITRFVIKNTRSLSQTPTARQRLKHS